MPPLEFSHSQPADNSAMQHLSSSTPDASFAREVQSQLSASMAQPMPGAESMMGMPGVPGAEQAISPLVQMIMRMPGHIGLASSFFEVLGNFFLPQTDMLSMFDPANFGLHIDLSGALPGDHGIDLSLLPHDAPLLDHLGTADLSSAHTLDMASDKLNLSLGGNSHFVSDNGSTSVSLGSQMNVSGPASFASPKFEGAGGLVSGPSLSENFNANSLAPNNRLFSDGAGIAQAGRSMMAQAHSAGSTLSAQALPQNATAMTSGTTGASTNLSAGLGNNAENVSAHATSANNVSYGMFDNLTGNKDMLAANNVSDSYHSTVGNVPGHGAGGDVAAKATGTNTGAGDLHKSAATTGSDNPGGLQAKAMSLNGNNIQLKADHAKLDLGKADHVKADMMGKADSTAHHVDGHKEVAEHKVASDAKAEAHKPEAQKTVAEHKAAPEHKVAAEHNAKADSVSKVESHKVADATKHAVKPTTVAAKPAAAAHAAQPAHAAAQAKPVEIAQATGAQPAQAGADASAAGQDNQFGQPLQDSNAAGSDAGQAAPDAVDKAGTGSTTGNGLEKSGVASTGKVYTIRSGDCLWNIAKDQLGDANKWSDIYKMNSDVLGANPSLIRPGASLNLPGVGGAESTGIGSVSHYTVKAGDNLWDIAKAQTGDATKWTELYKANQDIIGSNPSLIQPGQELTINTGAPDPASMQLSNAGTAGGGTLAQAPTPGAGAPGASSMGAEQSMAQGGDIGSLSQNAQPNFSQGGELSAPVPHQSLDMNANMNSSQFQQAHTPVSMQPAAKVLPVQAQPDGIIQPAHAAELHSNAGPDTGDIASLTADAAAHKGPVNTSTATDLLSMLNKRK